MNNIKPLHNNVLVERIEAETKTKGGIILPDAAKEKPSEGIVIAVGTGTKEDGKVIPLDVKTGDKVLFAKWGGTEITVDGKELLIMKESDILAIIN